MQLIGRSSVIAAVVAAFALVTLGASARSDKMAVSGRNIEHVTKFEPTKIGEDYMLAMFEAVGVTIHPDGEVTTNKMWGQLESIKGAGHDRGYFERTWPDGSTTLERFDSEAKIEADGTTVFRGRFEYVDGTGRFKGITGQGTFEGGRGYSNGMIVVDWQATMDVPAQ